MIGECILERIHLLAQGIDSLLPFLALDYRFGPVQTLPSSLVSSLLGFLPVDMLSFYFPSKLLGLLAAPSQLWQPTHLQSSEHGTPFRKHSQYFLRQLLFWQLHPRWCFLVAGPFAFWSSTNFGPNASGFLAVICSLDLNIKCSWAGVLQHGEQSHLEVHLRPAEKHSQYSLRHLDFLQFHGLDSGSPSEWTSGSVLSLPEALGSATAWGTGSCLTWNDFGRDRDFSSSIRAVFCRVSVE